MLIAYQTLHTFTLLVINTHDMGCGPHRACAFLCVYVCLPQLIYKNDTLKLVFEYQELIKDKLIA